MDELALMVARSAASLGTDKLRILIADDYGDLTLVMDIHFKYVGFDVRTVATGPEVLPNARRFLPHFVLLDIYLPGMSGYEAAAAIRTDPVLANTVIIAISAYDLEEDTERARAASFDRYFAKSFDLEEVTRQMLITRR